MKIWVARDAESKKEIQSGEDERMVRRDAMEWSKENHKPHFVVLEEAKDRADGHTASRMYLENGEVRFERDGALYMYVDGYGTRSDADARRLVACWNACEGIDPEAVPDLLAALEKILAFEDRLALRKEEAEAIVLAYAAVHKARGDK